MWPTNAGTEIGVASTKAFTAQVCALTALAIAAAARAAGSTQAEEARLVGVLLEAPRLITEAMTVEPRSAPWPTISPRRATCSTSAAARPSRWRWRAR